MSAVAIDQLFVLLLAQEWYTLYEVTESSKNNPLPTRFYKTDAGNEPVREWLKNLQQKDEKGAKDCWRIGKDISKVQFGWPMGKPLVVSIGGGLYEVRTTSSDKEYRVVFGIFEGEMVLLDAFRKPPNDYTTARKRWKEDQK